MRARATATVSVSHKENASVERILVITTSYPSDDDDAAGHFVKSEVERARAAGHDVTVFAPRARRTRDPNAARIVNIAHLGAFGTPGAMTRLRWRPDRWLGAILFVVTARWALRKHGPFDRCVAHFLIPSSWPICSGLALPVETVVHGSDLRLFEALPRWLRQPIARALRSRGRSYRCVSEDFARRLGEQFDSEPSVPIRVAPSPIEIPELPEKSELRRQLAIGPETLVVIASRLVQSKRVELALRTATALPRTRVVVCGGGPEYLRLSRRFPRAQFLGQLPRIDVLRWIAASDLVVCASREEGAPTVIREARALGTPVVTTAAGDVVTWAQQDRGIRVVV